MKRVTGKILCIIAAMVLSLSAGAQKARLMEGNPAVLKGVTKMNIQFDYSHMGVGRFDDEADYIRKRKTELNEKDPGRGTAWEKAWIADRKALFEPKFKEVFMSYADITVGDLPDAKYTLLFRTTFTEPGYNVYVNRKDARINGEAWIVETANPSNVIAKYCVVKATSHNFPHTDYTTGIRIQEAYTVAGMRLGKRIRKDIF